MDYKELLKKYVKYVMSAECFGIQPNEPVVFTDEEMEEIARITEEVIHD